MVTLLVKKLTQNSTGNDVNIFKLEATTNVCKQMMDLGKIFNAFMQGSTHSGGTFTNGNPGHVQSDPVEFLNPGVQFENPLKCY